jgi:hypothetical protein
MIKNPLRSRLLLAAIAIVRCYCAQAGATPADAEWLSCKAKYGSRYEYSTSFIVVFSPSQQKIYGWYYGNRTLTERRTKVWPTSVEWQEPWVSEARGYSDMLTLDRRTLQLDGLSQGEYSRALPITGSCTKTEARPVQDNQI